MYAYRWGLKSGPPVQYDVYRGTSDISRSQRRTDRPTGRDLLRGLRDIGPASALTETIMGAHYLEISSVSELTALGILGAVMISIAIGRFRWAR